MTYRLHFPADVFDAFKQLPELARRNLALALVDPQQDPLAYSEPYGQDDGIIRTVAQGHVTAVILLGHHTSTMTAVTIAHTRHGQPVGQATQTVSSRATLRRQAFRSHDLACCVPQGELSTRILPRQ